MTCDGISWKRFSSQLYNAQIFAGDEVKKKMPSAHIEELPSDRGVFVLQMSTLLFREPCRLSVKNLGFLANLSWIEDKSVCFWEK